jgi:hypothetical protein
MGLVTSRLRLLLQAKKDGVNFNSILTLGHQKININKKKLNYLKNEFKLNQEIVDDFDTDNRSFNNTFLKRILNVKNLSVMDYSDYQGANILHDLNYPIPETLEESFDVVIDGGTLEHIFNFPVAIENCMKMVRVGGSVFIFSMANNHCGHGFYQFSPELFFRIFDNNNGFETKSIALMRHPFPGAELSERQDCYKVIDPAILKRRNSLVSNSPLGIMVHAIKTKKIKIFRVYPFQSDYSNTWEEYNTSIKHNNFTGNSKLKLIFEKLPKQIKNNIIGLRQLWKFSLKRDKQAYRKLT